MDDKGLPKTSISSLMKELLGPHFKYSNKLVTSVHEIANEFIMKVAEDANKHCLEKSRTKISIDDVKKSLIENGIEEYMEQLTLAQVEYKEKKKKKKNKDKNKNLSAEELQKMKEKQNALFERAAHKKAIENRVVEDVNIGMEESNGGGGIDEDDDDFDNF